MSELVLIPARIVQVTPRAILVEHDGVPDNRVWLDHAEVAYEQGRDGAPDLVLLTRSLAGLRGIRP